LKIYFFKNIIIFIPFFIEQKKSNLQKKLNFIMAVHRTFSRLLADFNFLTITSLP